MKKFIVPAIALAIGVSVLGVNQASAASTTTATQIIAKADTAISARITSLNKLSTTIAKFKHLTSAQQTSLNNTVQSSITAMNTLKTKIDGETDLTVLKTDYASISKDYRIYMVVMPSTASIAATDNAMGTITTDQATLTTLNTRITTAQTAGKDVSSAQAAYTDATVKLADAQTQGQTLINAVTSLQPDMGNKTIEASNKAAVITGKTARKAMLADLVAAKKDIATIRTDLKTLKA